MKIQTVCAASFVLALAVRTWFLSWPIDELDRFFVPDDTYYTLTIARSLAQRGIPAASHGIATSGFQPLLAFLQVPFFWMGLSLDSMLRVAVGMGALFGSINAALLAFVAYDLGGRRAAFDAGLVGALVAVSPVALAVDLAGLETSLALLCTLVSVVYWRKLRKANAPKSVSWGLLGAGLGLMVLSRVDTCFFAGGVAVVETIARRYKQLAHVLAGSLLTVAPWWVYCLITFGSVVPESGAAVRELTLDHQALHLSLSDQAAWAAGYLVPGLFADVPKLHPWLTDHWWLAVVALTGTVGTVSLAALRARNEYSLLLVASMIVGAFYVWIVPAVWFFQRYLFVLIISLVLTWWLLLPPVPRRAGFSLALVGCLFGLSNMEPKFGLHGAKGYRTPALEAWRVLGPRAKVGAMQSGAIAYYAPAGAEVVNLDGVVDARSAQAIRERRLSNFMAQQHLEWFIDWPFNYQAVARFSSRPLSLVPVKGLTPQGPDRFVISKVSWSPPTRGSHEGHDD